MTYLCTLPRFSSKDFGSSMDQFFADVLGNLGSSDQKAGRTAWAPMNAWEEEGAFVVELELPGVKTEALEISVHGDELSVTAKRPETESVEGVTYHRQERPTGEFQRTIQLPTEVDAQAVEANLEAGVLTVRMPKAEAAMPRKIEVKSND